MMKPWKAVVAEWLVELKALKAAGEARTGEARVLAHKIEDMIALYEGPRAARGWAAAWR